MLELGFARVAESPISGPEYRRLDFAGEDIKSDFSGCIALCCTPRRQGVFQFSPLTPRIRNARIVYRIYRWSASSRLTPYSRSFIHTDPQQYDPSACTASRTINPTHRFAGIPQFPWKGRHKRTLSALFIINIRTTSTRAAHGMSMTIQKDYETSDNEYSDNPNYENHVHDCT